MVRLVWICALADSETDGTFYGSPEVLARAWNLDEETVRHGLSRLCQPDEKSATKSHEGRRIISEGENEWRVLNKRLYNPSGEPPGASTPRVWKHRALKSDGETIETDETGNDGNERNESNGRNALDKNRLEESESRRDKNRHGRFAPPSVEEIASHAKGLGYDTFDAEGFHAFYESKGWKVGNQPMRSWKAAIVSWRRHDGVMHPPSTSASPSKAAAQPKANPLGLRLSKDKASICYRGDWYHPHRDGKRWLTQDDFRPDGTSIMAEAKDKALNEEVYAAMTAFAPKETP